MKIIYGTGASSGIAAGKLKILRRTVSYEKAETCEDAEKEILLLNDAIKKAGDELELLYAEAVEKVGEHEASILSIHKMMLEDEDFVERIREYITDESLTAHCAVLKAGRDFAQTFAEMDNAYMNARSADIIAVSEKVASVLAGDTSSETAVYGDTPIVLAAHDLTPAETVMLDKDMILGFVTEKGSVMSHTAILARTIGIPSIVDIGEISDEYDGAWVVIDGNEGVMYIEPDEEARKKYDRTMQEAEEEKRRLEKYRGKTCINRDRMRVTVEANIGSVEDIDEALRNDAEGIGLFRSEFIFMRSDRPPTEEEQYEIYKSAIQKLNGRECVIRTLDAGADKRIPYITGDFHETNPSLGMRAVRLIKRYPELLLTQLRALYRAAAHGSISAMIPMIAVPSELEAVRDIACEARKSLSDDNIPFGKMKVGIMIETPSAAILADTLASMVDFFSIGTNDLIQYTVAADRENSEVAYLVNPLPESVRKLIRMTCAAAKREGIPVGVCGELGADTSETGFLLEAGVTKLSVAPPNILRVREAVTSSTGVAVSVRSIR